MKKVISCMIVLALLALSSIGYAGERAGAFSISPFIGGYVFDDAQALRENSMVYGLRLGYDWTDNWETEAVLDYVPAQLNMHGDTFVIRKDVPSWSYRLDMLYNFMPHSAFVPYLAAGLGGESIVYTRDSINGQRVNYPYGDGSTTDATLNFGGGVKYFMTDSIALRGDARYILDFNDKTLHNLEYSAGLTFLFGGATAAAKSEPVAEQPVEVPASEPAPGHFKYCITLHGEFDINRALIRPENRPEIAQVGDFMTKYPTTTAVIEGHSDNVGDADYNLGLSKRRAEAVVDYLVVNYGIERSRLSAKGFGMTHPVADNSTDEGRQKNRRIEAIIDCAFDVKQVPPPERLCISLLVDFGTGESDIKPQYKEEIAKVGDYLTKYPTTTAVIEGHTDNVGGYEYNMKLSRERAQNMVDYLVNNFGIQRSRLAAKGYGYTRRIAYNDTPEGRAKNRRINVVIDCVIK